MSTLLFVYGTLKRGGMNHAFLAGETFVAEARLPPGYRMFDVGGFPGLVPDPAARHSIVGELWAVTASGLSQLDRFEGVFENLYRRENVLLAAPPEHPTAQCYVYARSVAGLRDIGAEWRESAR